MDLIPLFPLKTVFFPGEKVNLHIFEPRYRQLIEEASAQQTTFGVPYVSEKGVQPICTEFKLEKIVNKYEDGKMDVQIEGFQLLKIHQFHEKYPGRLYPGGEIERISFDPEPNVEINKKVIPLIEELYEILNVDNVKYGNEQTFNTAQVCHKVGLTIEQEYEMMSLNCEADRVYYIYKHLLKFILNVRQTQEIKRKAALNGHFKILIPPF
jgi:hypothetical protein